MEDVEFLNVRVLSYGSENGFVLIATVFRCICLNLGKL